MEGVAARRAASAAARWAAAASAAARAAAASAARRRRGLPGQALLLLAPTLLLLAHQLGQLALHRAELRLLGRDGRVGGGPPAVLVGHRALLVGQPDGELGLLHLVVVAGRVQAVHHVTGEADGHLAVDGAAGGQRRVGPGARHRHGPRQHTRLPAPDVGPQGGRLDLLLRAAQGLVGLGHAGLGRFHLGLERLGGQLRLEVLLHGDAGRLLELVELGGHRGGLTALGGQVGRRIRAPPVGKPARPSAMQRAPMAARRGTVIEPSS